MGAIEIGRIQIPRKLGLPCNCLMSFINYQTIRLAKHFILVILSLSSITTRGIASCKLVTQSTCLVENRSLSCFMYISAMKFSSCRERDRRYVVWLLYLAKASKHPLSILPSIPLSN